MLNMCYNFNHTKFGTPIFWVTSWVRSWRIRRRRVLMWFFSTCLWFQLPSFYPVSVLHATCSMVDWPDSMKDCGPLEIFLTEPPLGGLRISIPRFAWTDHQSSHKYHQEAGELRVFIPGEPLPQWLSNVNYVIMLRYDIILYYDMIDFFHSQGKRMFQSFEIACICFQANPKNE